MLRSWPRLLQYALGAVLCFFITMVGGLLSEQSWGEKLSAPFLVVGAVGFWVFVAAAIVRIGKLIFRRGTKNARAPQERSYRAADAAGAMRSYVYNRSETFRFKGGAPLSWAGVILMLFLLPPLGIYFMWRKLAFEKARYFGNGTVLMVLGGVLAAITAPFIVLLALTGADSAQAMAAAVVLPGLWLLMGLTLLVGGGIMRRDGGRNTRLLIRVTEDRITDMRVLSEQLDVPYSEVSDRLNRLTDMGLLPGAYIDYRDDEVIVPGISKKIARRCAQCGATTVLYSNEERLCDYCGASI